MAPHSPCSIIKTHLRASRGMPRRETQERSPAEPEAPTPLPRHSGNARASDKDYGGPC